MGYAFLEGSRRNKAEYCLPSSSAALRMISHNVSIRPFALVCSVSSGLLAAFFTLLAEETELGVFCFGVPLVRWEGVNGCDAICVSAM